MMYTSRYIRPWVALIVNLRKVRRSIISAIESRRSWSTPMNGEPETFAVGEGQVLTNHRVIGKRTEARFYTLHKTVDGNDRTR